MELVFFWSRLLTAIVSFCHSGPTLLRGVDQNTVQGLDDNRAFTWLMGNIISKSSRRRRVFVIRTRFWIRPPSLAFDGNSTPGTYGEAAIRSGASYNTTNIACIRRAQVNMPGYAGEAVRRSLRSQKTFKNMDKGTREESASPSSPPFGELNNKRGHRRTPTYGSILHGNGTGSVQKRSLSGGGRWKSSARMWSTRKLHWNSTR